MKKTREIRIGLVLYGGVSLCVYINGVAQEFFRAVRGYKPYKLLKALLGADIVVDVISGTSAGGVNGIYLGYSLCQEGQNFLAFSQLWRDDGDIGKLLREPGGKVNSLLDGEGYYQEHLAAAFSRLKTTATLGEDPSPLDELDLFITGTDYEGNVYTRFDDSGDAITVKDHRTVFQLKYREDRANDFTPGDDSHAQLAKLARITSCFPVAFPPVEVTKKQDELITKWGYLSKKAIKNSKKEAPRYFLDGGILDNKPFTTTINAIYHRAAIDRPVTRKLFYVEPVPEIFTETETVSPPPNVLESGIAALVSIPGYESIAGDLKTILDRNRKLFRFSKLEKQIREHRGEEAIPKDALRIYYRSRISLLLDRVLVGILRQSGRDMDLPPGDQRLASGLYQTLFESFLALKEEDQDKILFYYDANYWARRLFHVIYTAMDKQEDLSKEQWRIVEECYRWTKCLEVIKFAMEKLVDEFNIDWRKGKDAAGSIWKEVSDALDALLSMDEAILRILSTTPEKNQLSDLMGILKSRIASWIDGSRPPVADDWLIPFLGRKLDEIFAGQAAWKEFDYIDTYRYPMQAASGIFELDQIHTFRISPLDCQLGFSCKSAQDKLSGDQFANFGGFFKKSWRSNDILWGRLDGMSKIFESLLTEEAMHLAPGGAAWLKYRTEVIDSFDWSGAPAGLKDWLLRLAAKDKTAIADLRPDQNNKIPRLDQLAGFLQEEVAYEGLAMVALDSIEEQIEWNCVKAEGADGLDFHIDQLSFAKPNSGLIGIAAQQLAKQAIDKRRIPDLKEFFSQGYKVGEETLGHDVPKPVLVELASRAALVFRDCIMAPMESAGVKVSGNKLYKFGLDYPLRVTNSFAKMVRYAPTSARVITWVLLFLSIAAILTGVSLRDALLYNAVDKSFNLRNILLMIVLPLAYLAILPELLDWQQIRGNKWRIWSRWILGIASLAGALAIFFRFDSIQALANQWMASNGKAVQGVFIATVALICVYVLSLVARIILSIRGKKPPITH